MKHSAHKIFQDFNFAGHPEKQLDKIVENQWTRRRRSIPILIPLLSWHHDNCLNCDYQNPLKPIISDPVRAEPVISGSVRSEPAYFDPVRRDARSRSASWAATNLSTSTIVTTAETFVITTTTMITTSRLQPQRLQQVRKRPVARNFSNPKPNSFGLSTTSLFVLFGIITF